MCHSDDDGLKLPPRIAHKQIVILPVVPKPELEAAVYAYAEECADKLRQCNFHGKPLTVVVDKRDRRGGEKNWEWIKKGIPLRIEVGPRDMESQSVMICRRDRPHKEKAKVDVSSLQEKAVTMLEEIQQGLFETARNFRDNNLHSEMKTLKDMEIFFTPKNPDKPEIHGGFVKAKWCGDPETEKLLDPLKVTIRCLPLEQSHTQGTCILTGRPATLDAIFSKSY
jgi:prolyl-tRNA synthetase